MVYKEIFKIQICEYLNYKHLYSKIREKRKFSQKMTILNIWKPHIL